MHSGSRSYECDSCPIRPGPEPTQRPQSFGPSFPKIRHNRSPDKTYHPETGCTRRRQKTVKTVEIPLIRLGPVPIRYATLCSRQRTKTTDRNCPENGTTMTRIISSIALLSVLLSCGTGEAKRPGMCAERTDGSRRHRAAVENRGLSAVSRRVRKTRRPKWARSPCAPNRAC